MARIVPATSEWIAKAAGIVREGGLVAFPTETVYGLGANALDAEAVRRIFQAKGRPADNPVIVHVVEADDLGRIAGADCRYLESLTDAFWPGPLSLVLPKRDVIPEIVTAGGLTVAVRAPKHPVALALLRAAGVPIAAPSANRSEAVSPTLAQHVAESLGDAVDLILDGGPCTVGLESTVLNLTVDPPEILRPGAITAEQIERVIGVRPAVRAAVVDGRGILASPGQMRRHYAPMKPLIVSDDAVAEAAAAPNSAAISHSPPADIPPGVTTRILQNDPKEYGRLLYATLRELDAGTCERIFVQSAPDGDEWLAIRDRLSRAAYPSR